VVIKGNITLSAKVSMPSYTVLEIVGNVVLANGVNDYMFEYADAGGNTHIDIVGNAIIDGNGDNQNAGGIINLKGDTSGAIFRLENLRLLYGYDSNIRAITNGRISANGLQSSGRAGAQWNLVMTNGDSLFSSCVFTGYADTNVYLQGTSGNSFSGCYFGGAAEYNVHIMSTAFGNHFTGCTCSDAVKHGYFIEGNENTINGGLVLCAANTNNNTYSGVYINNANYTIVSGIIIKGRDISHMYKYGVEEVGSSDYNMIDAVTAIRYIGTYGFKIVGSNTVVGEKIGTQTGP